MNKQTPRIQILISAEGAPEELILVDGSLAETHADAALPTDHPVGQGSQITDHVQQAPRFFTADLYVTDTPTRTPEQSITSDFQVVTTVRRAGDGNSESNGPNQALDRGREIYDRLLELKNSAQLMTLVTSKQLYKNMLLVAIDVTKDRADWDTIIRCDWREVLIVSSQETEEVRVSEPQIKPGRRDRGSQPTSDETESRAQRPRDLLGAIVSAVGG